MAINSSAVEFKTRERESWASAAAGWGRRDELLQQKNSGFNLYDLLTWPSGGWPSK